MAILNILAHRKPAAREMLLALRKLKRSYFDQREFRKYLLYALGETVLIVIGIIIALRIDAWNTERIAEQTLRGSLDIIARNIESDLTSVAAIEEARRRAYELSLRWQEFHDHPRRESATVEQITFASQVIYAASERRYLIANTSGFDVLKTSGALGQLRGYGIETSLYDYYDTVTRIDRIERDYNAQVGRLELAMAQDWPIEFERWVLSGPDALTAERFESLQPAFNRLLLGAATNALIDMPRAATDLLYEYEKLKTYGRELVRLIGDGQLDMDQAAVENFGALHDPRSSSGNPILIINGRIVWQTFHTINSDANNPILFGIAAGDSAVIPFTHDSIETVDDHLAIRLLGGAEWTGIWLATGESVATAVAKDYSAFDTLVVEIKGETGEEIIALNIEDSEDPMDGTSTRIFVELSEQWETYEFDLADFKTADFSSVDVPLGFISFDEPVSFFVRNAYYATRNK
jgi:hypothetical protein